MEINHNMVGLVSNPVEIPVENQYKGKRRVPAQDGLFALILWYVEKTLYWS